MMTMISRRSKAEFQSTVPMGSPYYLGCEPLFAGTRIVVPQALQRTVFPRATSGMDSTLRHVRFGHMIRTIFWSDIKHPPSRHLYIGTALVFLESEGEITTPSARYSPHIPDLMDFKDGLRAGFVLSLHR